MSYTDVTESQIYGLDPAVDIAPYGWTNGDLGTTLPPTSVPVSVTQSQGDGNIGGASPFQWAQLTGGIAGAIAQAFRPSTQGMPTGFYRDPKTGATMAVGSGGQVVGVPTRQPAGSQSLIPILLLAGLVMLAKKGG